MSKPRLVKNYAKLPDSIKEEIRKSFPRGYLKHLITFPDAKGKLVNALPYESEEYYYMIKMPKGQALDSHLKQTVDSK